MKNIFAALAFILFLSSSFAACNFPAGWNSCMLLNITENASLDRSYEPIEINLTGLSFPSGACINELRVYRCTVSGCGTGVEIPSQVLATDNSTWCQIVFAANISYNGSYNATHAGANSSNFAIYFNNSGATAPGYTNPWTFSDFSNGTQVNNGTLASNSNGDNFWFDNDSDNFAGIYQMTVAGIGYNNGGVWAITPICNAGGCGVSTTTNTANAVSAKVAMIFTTKVYKANFTVYNGWYAVKVDIASTDTTPLGFWGGFGGGTKYNYSIGNNTNWAFNQTTRYTGVISNPKNTGYINFSVNSGGADRYLTIGNAINSNGTFYFISQPSATDYANKVNMLMKPLSTAINPVENAVNLVVSLNSPANNAFLNSTSVLFNWSVNSTFSSVDCNLTRNNSLLIKKNCAGSGSCTSTNTTPDGYYLWNVSCWNGTMGNDSPIRNLTIDSTSPVLSIQSPANTTYAATSVPLNFTAQDNGSGVFFCAYYLDGGPQVGGCGNSTLSGLSQGAHNVRVNMSDNANNMVSAIVYFTVDSIAPTVAIQNPTNTTYNTTSISLNFTASDSGSGIASCSYTLDANAPISGCLNTSLTLAQGQHTITANATDGAGNNNSASVIFLVDSVAPLISNGWVNITQGTRGQPVRVNVSASDPTSGLSSVKANGVSMGLSGSTYTLATTGTTLGCPVLGICTITFTAIDNAGNSNSTTANYTIVQATNVSILSPLNYTYGLGNISLNYTVSPNSVSCVYSLDGAANISLGTCANISLSIGIGGHNIVVYALDISGDGGSNITYFSISNNPIQPIDKGMSPIIEGMSSDIMNIIGNGWLAGLIILLFFGGWVAVSGMQNDAKMVLIVLAGFLSFVLLPDWIMKIAFLIIGFIITLALGKLFERW